MNEVDKWQKFWKDKTDPGHGVKDCDHLFPRTPEEYFRLYAKELTFLFDNRTSKILEIGCGNGSLFPFYGFDNMMYKGVDFSQSMLNEFQNKFPDINVGCHEASSYLDKETYELIFSNQVVQFFDNQMFSDHLSNAKKMMAPNAILVCASIPWKQQKFRYILGKIDPQVPKKILKKVLKNIITPNNLAVGNWFDFQDIRNLARQHGFTVEFYPSMCYLYRFHAVLKIA